MPRTDPPVEGTLRARPRAELADTDVVREAGELTLGLSADRDGLLYVPNRYTPQRRAPLLVLFHGAGGNARHALAPFVRDADRCGVILLAPESRERSTWDVIDSGTLGPDVAFVDRALEVVFARYAVDPDRIAVGGFSDGASYALTLGLLHGDLFRKVLAFSPGFSAASRIVGRPRIFVAHGTRDEVLPIEHCSRRVVPSLRRAGLDVEYREFEGPHVVPPELVRVAFDEHLCSAADA